MGPSPLGTLPSRTRSSVGRERERRSVLALAVPSGRPSSCPIGLLAPAKQPAGSPKVDPLTSRVPGFLTNIGRFIVYM